MVVGLLSLVGLVIWRLRLFLTLTGGGAGVLFPCVDEDVLHNGHPRISSSSWKMCVKVLDHGYCGLVTVFLAVLIGHEDGGDLVVVGWTSEAKKQRKFITLIDNKYISIHQIKQKESK